MSEILYCIDHETFELAQASQLGIVHEYVVRTEFGTEVDFCFFDLGWAYCSPPEEYPDWDLDFEHVEEEAEEEIDWDELNETILESYEMEGSDVMEFRTKVWSFGSPD